MLVKVPLAGDPKFYMMLQQGAVWAAIPHESAVLLHLVQPLEWPMHPDKVISGQLGPTELIVGLHQYVIGGAQGGILPCRMPMADVCKVFQLVPFTAAGQNGDVPIGLSAGYIFSYAPAFSKEGTLVGTNIYTSRPMAKIGNVKVHVTEPPEIVTGRLGIKPEDLFDTDTMTMPAPPMSPPAPQTTQ